MIVFLLSVMTVGALVLAAFCAGAETGFLSIRRGRLIHLVRAGSQRAKVLLAACQRLGRTTTALLIGNNLATVAYSSASAALSSIVFADSSVARSAWGVVAAFAVLFFGEFAPKLLCATRPIRRMLALAPVWKVFSVVFTPIGAVLLKLIGRFIPKREMGDLVTPDAVLKILEDRKDGVKLSNLESALIRRVLLLRSKGKLIEPDSLLSALDDCVI